MLRLVYQAGFTNPFYEQQETRLLPIYNVAPRPGELFDLGMLIVNGGAGVHTVASVRTTEDFGVTAIARNTSDFFPIFSVTVNLWGVPADPSHDERRACVRSDDVGDENVCPAGIAVKPFLTNSSACGGSRTATASVDSWQDATLRHATYTSTTDIQGCEKLEFTPEISVTPQTHAASTPTGIDVALHIPQDEGAYSLATPPMRKAVVTLPRASPSTPPRPTASAPARRHRSACSDPNRLDPDPLQQRPGRLPRRLQARHGRGRHPAARPPAAGLVYLAKQERQPLQLPAGHLHGRRRPKDGASWSSSPAESTSARDRSAHHHLRRQPPAAVRRLQARLLRRRPALLRTPAPAAPTRPPPS